jgi:hypothetical protein
MSKRWKQEREEEEEDLLSCLPAVLLPLVLSFMGGKDLWNLVCVNTFLWRQLKRHSSETLPYVWDELWASHGVYNVSPAQKGSRADPIVLDGDIWVRDFSPCWTWTCPIDTFFAAWTVRSSFSSRSDSFPVFLRFGSRPLPLPQGLVAAKGGMHVSGRRAWVMPNKLFFARDAIEGEGPWVGFVTYNRSRRLVAAERLVAEDGRVCVLPLNLDRVNFAIQWLHWYPAEPERFRECSNRPLEEFLEGAVFVDKSLSLSLFRLAPLASKKEK